jgi:hypothetical protein
MKTFSSFSRILALCFVLSYTLCLPEAKSAPEVTVLASNEQGLQEPAFNLEAIENPGVNQTKIDLPAPITLEPTSLMEWWSFLYALLTPIAIWLFGKFWPSSTKQALVTKATTVALVILIVVLTFKGFTFATLSQALIALLMQVFMYDKVYQPLGLNTAKKENYTNPK